MRRPIYWDTTDSPIGPIFVGLNSRGVLVRLSYGVTRLDFLKEIKESGGQEVWNQEAASNVIRQLGEYFAGERKDFDVPVDLADLTPFQRDVLQATQRIPYGEVWSYGDVAATIGNPKAARAVGRALGQNPITVVVPCHRVVAADGSLHGYSGVGGLATKQFLLSLEGCCRVKEVLTNPL